MNHQQPQEQLHRYLSFLNEDKNNVKLLLDISYLYIELDDLANAQYYLDKAKTIDTKSCFAQQGLIHLKRQQLEEAIEHFQKALADNDTEELRYQLGFTYYVDNQLEHAWGALSTINETEYTSLAQLLMARILHQQNELDEAIDFLNEYIKNTPNDAEALALLSLLYFDNNNEPLAQELSQRALSLDSTLYDARLVNIMLRLMTQETSLDEIKQLIEVNPQDSRLWFALGSTYMIQGDFASALVHLKNTLKIHPEFYDCHIALAWCQLLSDEVESAHETYQNAISLVDDLADGWAGLAIIYALNTDLEKAEQLISKAHTLNTNCFLTQIADVIYLNHKNPEKAQQHLFATLTNQQTPVSEKLALVINELAVD
jgi:tetratricopeptide (TPR) repeat protein